MFLNFWKKRRNQAQKLTFRYLLVLFLLAIVGIGWHSVLVMAVDSGQSEYAAIQLSLSQESVAERLVQNALRLTESKTPEYAKIWRERLLESVQKMFDRHKGLINKDIALGLRGSNSKEVNAIFFQPPHSLDAKVLQFVVEVKAVAEAAKEKLSIDDPHLKALSDSVVPLLEAQSALTHEYEIENQVVIDRAKDRSLMMLCAFLVLLVIMALLLFRPMVRRVQKEIDLITESEELIRSIVESSPDAIIMCDSRSIIREWSPQAEKIFGWKKDEVVQKALSEIIIPQRLRQKHEQGMDRYLATGKANILNRRVEFAAVDRNGREFPIELTIAAVPRKGEMFFSSFVRDITEQKRIQKELAAYQGHLEELLATRTKELEANYQKLKASERLAAIGELAAKVAHEIKNPLAAIRGGVRLLSKGMNSDSSQGELFGDVLKETQRLDETVNDLLNLARPLVVKKVKVELGTFILEMMESWKLQREIARHQIQVDVESDLAPVIDLRLMSQILNNLVINAAQAMETPGTIAISSKREGENFVLKITDTGPGLPESSISSVFTPFFTTKSWGTGLGLAICKKNVEAMDGTIFVQSKPGHGASFVITLPLSGDVKSAHS